MTNPTVQDTVFKLVSRVLKTPISDIHEDTSPDQIARWDSLEHMNLVLALEEEFGIQFEAAEIGQMQSVKLILLVLAEKGVNAAKRP